MYRYSRRLHHPRSLVVLLEGRCVVPVVVEPLRLEVARERHVHEIRVGDLAVDVERVAVDAASLQAGLVAEVDGDVGRCTGSVDLILTKGIRRAGYHSLLKMVAPAFPKAASMVSGSKAVYMEERKPTPGVSELVTVSGCSCCVAFVCVADSLESRGDERGVAALVGDVVDRAEGKHDDLARGEVPAEEGRAVLVE
jgi:hypothetical protein